ncbi:hypothetical protein T07_7973 [Trichinella nelsoni]|uniref:Uncharacterized protein n=1 Tax=Trichinella nelsoni TaxID=6336 RepID=A0A0V0RY51_9BILA|nr:hypothetical protein T07_7973 [Trichinella nelsoni]
MERTENHQEAFYEVGLEKLKLDDDQLKDYEKQVKPNDEDIEETGQDEQAMETDAENNSNSVIENESELTVSESRQRSMLDEEKKAGECIRNINADKVNEGVFEGSPDGNGQSSSRNEAQVMYDTAPETTNEQTDENMDASQNGVLGDEIDCDRQISHICPAFLLLWSMRYHTIIYNVLALNLNFIFTWQSRMEYIIVKRMVLRRISIAACRHSERIEKHSISLICSQLRENGEDENHQETFHEVLLEKLNLDEDQLKDYEKQVKPNDEDIEETGQDEQTMETDDVNNSNSVNENESELTVSESRQRSMLDEEKKAGECVRNINADKVNEGVFEGSPDGNGQSSSRNEAQVIMLGVYSETSLRQNEF